MYTHEIVYRRRRQHRGRDNITLYADTRGRKILCIRAHAHNDYTYTHTHLHTHSLAQTLVERQWREGSLAIQPCSNCMNNDQASRWRK